MQTKTTKFIKKMSASHTQLFGILLCIINVISTQTQPNILFILADDLGWANVGFHRDPTDNEVVTPNIDSMFHKSS